MAWKDAHQVVLKIYLLTKSFPKEELFGLSSQMRRAAVSTTSNIAEGFGRRTFKDKVHFFYQARGSLNELQNQLIIARDLAYIQKDEFIKTDDMIERTQRLLYGLISKIRSVDKF